MTLSHVDIRGGSIAALVAADTLTRAGATVHVHTNAPARGWLPTYVAGHRLEPGCRLLELDYDDPFYGLIALDIADYQPGHGAHRAYMAQLRDWVRTFDLEHAEIPCTIERAGRTGRDFILHDDLIDLPALCTPTELDAIAADATEACKGIGVAGWREHELPRLSFLDASRDHCATFHDLFVEPLLAKIVPGRETDVRAIDHRRVWLPLFWPETLREAATGTLTYRPHRRQLTGLTDLVERLVHRLAALDVFRLVDDHCGPADITFPDHRGPRGTTHLAWLEPTGEPTSVTWIVDPDDAAWRVTTTPDAQILEMATPWHQPPPNVIHTTVAHFPLDGQTTFNDQVVAGLAAAARLGARL